MVAFFDLGVSGIAWATFLAQGVASVLAFVILLSRLRGLQSAPFRRFSGNMLLRVAYLAVPSILQQNFISVGNLFIQWLVNSYNWEIVGGYWQL